MCNCYDLVRCWRQTASNRYEVSKLMRGASELHASTGGGSAGSASIASAGSEEDGVFVTSGSGSRSSSGGRSAGAGAGARADDDHVRHRVDALLYIYIYIRVCVCVYDDDDASLPRFNNMPYVCMISFCEAPTESLNCCFAYEHCTLFAASPIFVTHPCLSRNNHNDDGANLCTRRALNRRLVGRALQFSRQKRLGHPRCCRRMLPGQNLL